VYKRQVLYTGDSFTIQSDGNTSISRLNELRYYDRVLEENELKTIYEQGVSFLSAPQNLQATLTNPTTVQLQWESSEDASGYLIYRSTTENGNYELVGSV